MQIDFSPKQHSTALGCLIRKINNPRPIELIIKPTNQPTKNKLHGT